MFRYPSSMIKFLRWSAVFVAVFAAWVIYLGTRPDFDLHFTRYVPSSATSKLLSLALDDLSQWPRWHYSLKSAQIVDDAGNPTSEQKLFDGARLLLNIDPGKGPWKRVQILTRVLAYVPGDFVRLGIVSDSKGKIAQLLEQLEWQINVLPAPPESEDPKRRYKSAVRGTAKARTTSFRARVFGAVTEKIVMTQVFYPDLIKLAEIDSPESTSPTGVPGL
jgi:hypothetical protein